MWPVAVISDYNVGIICMVGSLESNGYLMLIECTHVEHVRVQSAVGHFSCFMSTSYLS